MGMAVRSHIIINQCDQCDRSVIGTKKAKKKIEKGNY